VVPVLHPAQSIWVWADWEARERGGRRRICIRPVETQVPLQRRYALRELGAWSVDCLTCSRLRTMFSKESIVSSISSPSGSHPHPHSCTQHPHPYSLATPSTSPPCHPIHLCEHLERHPVVLSPICMCAVKEHLSGRWRSRSGPGLSRMNKLWGRDVETSV
jgi:hypothetical protein